MTDTPQLRNALMRAAVFSPEALKGCKTCLSDIDRHIVRLIIQKTNVTSTYIADQLSLSPENAVNRMRRLYTAKYLTREIKNHPTGGHLHVYNCDPDKWG